MQAFCFSEGNHKHYILYSCEQRKFFTDSSRWEVSVLLPLSVGRIVLGCLLPLSQGACVHQGCEYLAGCRVYQLVMPTCHVLIPLVTSSHVMTVGSKT